MMFAATVLMDRQTAGFICELHYDHIHGTYIRVVEGEGEERKAVVPPEKAMDAFHHPYLYLPEATR